MCEKVNIPIGVLGIFFEEEEVENMKEDSQLSGTRLKNSLPYIFTKRAHKIMWAIGALVLSVTVPFLNSQFQTDTDASYKSVQPTKTAAGSHDVEINSTNNSSSVRINDQIIPVPPNGSVHKTIQGSGGQMKLDVSIDTSSSSDQSNSSTSLHMNVNSQQETTIDNSE